jgi:hypothetical protein
MITITLSIAMTILMIIITMEKENIKILSWLTIQKLMSTTRSIQNQQTPGIGQFGWSILSIHEETSI